MNKTYRQNRKAAGPIKISGLLSDVTRETFRKRGFAEGKLITDWDVIVGKELARHSSPIKIIFPRGRRDGGTLHVRISGSLATELQHMEPMILEKISAYFGYKAVGRIKLKHENPKVLPAKSKKKPVKKNRKQIDFGNSLDDIKDEKLKAALVGLGQSVLDGDET